MKNEYNKGERVKFLPEWSEGDDQIFVVVGEDEGKGRVTISPEVWSHGSLVPQEVVQTSMIERA